MRFYLLLFIACLFVCSCNREHKVSNSVTIKMFTVDSLEYPESGTIITDSIRRIFIEKFFAPWDKSSSELLTSLKDFPGRDLTYLHGYLEDDEWFGENKKPHKRFLREEIVNNVLVGDFPNFKKKGIVIAHTNLRRVPSNKPGFDTYSKAGEGYPFDYFQETNLWANTPLQLLHLTKDKQWCYVVSPYYKGWVKFHDIAVVSEDFIRLWKTGNYAMPISDTLSLQNTESHYAVKAKIGMVFPFNKMLDEESIVQAYYVSSDENQNAQILKAEIDAEAMAFDNHKFNKENLKNLVVNLVGRPYGWGGNLENRDCSSMIRDMMATYRIWLPRDSGDQIEIGKKYELNGTLEEKKILIKEKGIPFQTILRKKGHNMLYVGNDEKGDPLVFHAIWGLKTTYDNTELANYLKNYPIEGLHIAKDGSLEGRHIIGESVITSVMAGEDDFGVTTSLLEEMYTMSVFIE